MVKSTTFPAKSKAIIDGVEVTCDTLTRRDGVSLSVRYLRNIGIFPQMEIFFDSINFKCCVDVREAKAARGV